jgi:hypothetical protein
MCKSNTNKYELFDLKVKLIKFLYPCTTTTKNGYKYKSTTSTQVNENKKDIKRVFNLTIDEYAELIKQIK